MDASAAPEISLTVATDASAPDTHVDPYDAGPKAGVVPLPLDKPASAGCGMTVTLTRQGHKEYAGPGGGSVGIWEFSLVKGGVIVQRAQTEDALHIEGAAFGCVYVIEGEQGSEHITTVPSTDKPFTEDEAFALAEAETKARGLPHGHGSSRTQDSGVLSVVFTGATQKTHMRVGLFTRRLLSIAIRKSS